ncbi:MAG TPA: hypothetical protein EYP65_08740, partial [Armatimonadetes bacterium]|nr:hypothetical protein [Armatimonadota bacterium]
MPNSGVKITRLKRLYPQTAIVLDGRPSAFIVPGGGKDLLRLAERLNKAFLERTGVTLPIVPAGRLVDEDWRVDLRPLGGRNIIAIGNVNNNRLLSVLYGERYVVADSLYPGRGGFVIRTVHAPFADGTNVLVLAGSDLKGMRKAIEVFIEEFLSSENSPSSRPSLVLPRPIVKVKLKRETFRFFPGPSQKRQPQYTTMEWFERNLKKAGFMDEGGRIRSNDRPGENMVSLLRWLSRLGQTYFRTGDERLLPLMKELVRKNLHLLERPPEVKGMEARTAYCVHWWDILEELPIWTDEERLAITNALLLDARQGHERRPFHRQVLEGAAQAMDENHGTFSALHSFNAWLYFHKYYRDLLPESEYWMRCARAVFSAQASTFQILEDAAGYLCYCPIHTMDYALASRDLTYFKRGIARHHAMFVSLVCVNNLGLSTGFGDSPSLVCPEFFEAIAPAAWFHRDPKLYWVVRNFLPKECGLRIFQKSIAFDLTVRPQRPDDWTGVIRFPIYEMPLK